MRDEVIITPKEKINKNNLFSVGWLKLSENFFPLGKYHTKYTIE